MNFKKHLLSTSYLLLYTNKVAHQIVLKVYDHSSRLPSITNDYGSRPFVNYLGSDYKVT